MDVCIWKIYFFLLLGLPLSQAQSGFLIDDQNGLYRITNSCQTTFLFSIGETGTISDLTLDPQGNLYGISTEGDLFQIDTLNQKALKIHSFLYLQDFYALTCSVDGTMYVSGSEGYLYSYQTKGDREYFFGDMGFNITGDLVILHGMLYGSTDKNQLVQLDLLRPQQAQILAKFPHKSTGLMIRTDPNATCPAGYILTIGQDGKVYEYQEKTASFTSLCNVMAGIAGAAGMMDFYDPDALLQSQLTLQDANCLDQGAAIRIRWRNQQDRLSWKVNDRELGQDSALQDLPSGSYHLTTRDPAGCTDTMTVELLRADGPTIQAVQSQNAPCQSGAGALQVLVSGNGIAGFQMDDQDIQQSPQFSDVSPGVHYLAVIDSFGCMAWDTVEVSFTSTDSLFTVQVSPATCNEANGRISLKSLQADLKFELDGSAIAVTASDILRPAGTYRVRGIDTSGCQQEEQVIVPDGECAVFIPSVFSPDRDGVNDVFKIYYQNQREVTVQDYRIFDRWGALLYADGGFGIHGDDHWWDGTKGGQTLTTGVYIYRIVLVDDQGQEDIKQGTVTLLK